MTQATAIKRVRLYLPLWEFAGLTALYLLALALLAALAVRIGLLWFAILIGLAALILLEWKHLSHSHTSGRAPLAISPPSQGGTSIPSLINNVKSQLRQNRNQN